MLEKTPKISFSSIKLKLQVTSWDSPETVKTTVLQNTSE